MFETIGAPVEEADEPDAARTPDVLVMIMTSNGRRDQNKSMRCTSVLYAGNGVLREVETGQNGAGDVVKTEEGPREQPEASV